MVVEACVENGAHHIDISGEPGYLEKMQLNYHAKVDKTYVTGQSVSKISHVTS